MKRSILLAALFTLSGAFMGVLYATRAAPQLPPTKLAQPNHWVAFSADVRVTDPILPLQTGRYYRNAKGSTRWEIVRTTDRKAIINILNVSTSTWYTQSPGAGWVSQGMDLVEGEYQPMPWNSAMFGLMRYPLRADVGTGGSGKLNSQAGFEAYVHTSSSGTTRLVVPELNFFAVSRQYLSGRSWLFTNVDKGNQPDTLFVPPSDAVVTPLSQRATFKNREAPFAK